MNKEQARKLLKVTEEAGRLADETPEWFNGFLTGMQYIVDAMED